MTKVVADMIVSLDKLVEVEGRNARTVYTRTDMDELKAQIKGAEGIVVPLTVEYPDERGNVALINGHRRHRALLELAEEGLHYTVPVHFQKVQDEKQVLQFVLVSNEGVPLTIMDRAEAYKKFLSLGGDRKELQAMLGKTNAHISQMLTLSNAPAQVKKQLAVSKITVTQALELCKEAGTTTVPKPVAPVVVAPKQATTKAVTQATMAAEEGTIGEEEITKKTEAMVRAREDGKRAKKNVAKAVQTGKKNGVILDAEEKTILSILKQHGIDGLIQKAQRAVDVAKTTAADKREFNKWVSLEQILSVVTQAMNEDSNWD